MAEQEAKMISMKLLIDKTQKKILFAEAGKECVDFILHILSLPLGTVAGFLTKKSMPGSIGSIYGSLENLGTNYLEEGLNKDCLLKPKPASDFASNIPILAVKPAATTFYCCNQYYQGHPYFSDGPGTKCPRCGVNMKSTLTYVAPPSSGRGYVNGVVSYMIMDDLSVQPIVSMISCITLLNKFNVEHLFDLEEKEVTLDMSLGVALLKASLVSKTVLNDVFLPQKSAARSST